MGENVLVFEDRAIAIQLCLPENWQFNRPISSQAVYWDSQRSDQALGFQYSVYRRASKLLGRSSVASVADLGCGTGSKLTFLATRFPKIKFVGIDREVPQRSPSKNLSFKVLDLNAELPEEFVGSFDFVICSDVIEHIWKPDEVLVLIRRMLKKGGTAIISTPDRDRLRGKGVVRSCNKSHVCEWNLLEFQALLQKNQFTILSSSLLLGRRPSVHKNYFLYALRRLRTRSSLRTLQCHVVAPRVQIEGSNLASKGVV